MAFNQDLYYPQRPGGPYLSQGDFPGVPRIVHSNFDTLRSIEDKVRNIGIFQGLNEQQLQGYIQNEIDYAHTNRIGLKADKGDDRVNRAAEAYDGH